MAKNGNDIMIFAGGTLIAGTKSNEMNTKCELLEVSSPMAANTTAAGWRQYLTGRKEWDVTVGYLVAAVSGLQELLSVGNTYTLRFGERNTQNGVTGTAILTQCRITATRGSLVQGSFSFTGTGELTPVTTPSE